MGDLPRAFIVHETPTRIRLKVPEKRRDKAFFGEASRELADKFHEARVEVNPLTASILISSHDVRKVADGFGECRLFNVATEQEKPEPALREVSRGLEEINRWVSRTTGGWADARSYVVLGLLTAAMVQIARGKVLTPAITLLWYATEALWLWTDRANDEQPRGRMNG